jgi:hypothetical protein
MLFDIRADQSMLPAQRERYRCKAVDQMPFCREQTMSVGKTFDKILSMSKSALQSNSWLDEGGKKEGRAHDESPPSGRHSSFDFKTPEYLFTESVQPESG